MTPARRWLVCLCLLTWLVPRAPAATNETVALLDWRDAMAAAAAVTPGAYPDADDVLVDNAMRVVYEPDGTAVTIDDMYTKVLTEKGKDDQQSLSFNFTLPYETLDVPLLEVIKPDGRRIPVDVAAQGRVMVDPSQMRQNIYNPNDKVFTVGVPGLETGDVCHVVERTRTVKPRVPDTWSDYSVFEYTSPIRRLVYEVHAPKERPLRSIRLKGEVPGTVRYTTAESGGRTVHRWEVRDVPRVFAEPGMPALHTVVQRLLVSTIPDWRDISRWYWNLCLPHLEARSDALREKVRELTAGVADRDRRIERIFQFVSQQIRYMGLTTESESPGYEPHDVSLTFENRYGVCRDKAALLVAMLREAGLPAFPVLIMAGPRKDEEVPQPYFNHAIVAVADAGGGYTLMDPTDENTADLLPAYLCDKSYLVAHPDGERLRTSPIVPADRNMMRIDTTGALDERGTLRATSVLQFDGMNDNGYRGYFARLKPEERRRFFEGAVKRRVAGATLSAFTLQPEDMQDTSAPLRAELRYEAPDYPVRGEGATLLPLPWLGGSIGYVNFVLGRTGLEQRRFPLATEIACGVEERFTLALGPALAGAPALPGCEPVETSNLVFSTRVELRTNTLHGASTFQVRTVEFSAADYRVLKQNLKDIEYSRRQAPLFPAAAEAGRTPDVRVLSQVRRYELQDARSWTLTQTVRKQVLTYAGKKDHSELEFAYNPAWESVRLASATVTGTNGARKAVAASEMNVMDADWVGAAPRYPPGRTLVVNLPAVEVGSVIDYQVVVHRTNDALFSTVETFAGFEPTLTNRLEVEAPAGLALRIAADPGVPCRRSEAAGRRTYVWESVNQTVLAEEDALPPEWSFCPSVFVSAGDWEAYARDVADALGAGRRGDREAARLARELTRGVRDPLERLRRIRDHIARAVRLAGPALTEAPLLPSTPPDRTLAEGYGSAADLAVLYAAMLRAAGLKPELVLAASSGPRVESLRRPLLACPQRELFDTVLARVPVRDGFVYAGDTDQYAPPGATAAEGRPALTLEGEPFVVAPLTGQTSRVSSVYEIRLETNGAARIALSQAFYGMDFATMHRRFAEMPPEERRRFYLEMLGELSQSAKAETDLVTDFSAYPGTLRFTARVDRFAVRAGDAMYLLLPGSMPELASLRADRRESPLYRSAPLESDWTCRVFLPAGAGAVLAKPADIEWDAPGGLGRVAARSVVTRGPDAGVCVTVTRGVKLAGAVVPALDYPSLLQANRRLQHPGGRAVVFAVGAGPRAAGR